GGHHPTGGVVVVGEQPAQRLGLLGLHQLQQLFGRLVRQLGQQVGGVVGLHHLEHVGCPPGRQRREDVDTVVLGQLLQDVGQRLVVEGGGDLRAAPGRELVQPLRQVCRLEVVMGG